MLPIAELMRHEIAVGSPEAPVRRVVEVMVNTGVEGVLVVDGRGRVIGSVGATSAIRLFDECGVSVMPVVDHGILVGAVFRGDLVKRLLLPGPLGRPAES
jgi:CBS domain-containing protein